MIKINVEKLQGDKEICVVIKRSSNKGFSGNSSILTSIIFRDGGPRSSSQSHTATTHDRYVAAKESPTHIQSHFVLPSHKDNPENQKSLNFLPTL